MYMIYIIGAISKQRTKFNKAICIEHKLLLITSQG